MIGVHVNRDEHGTWTVTPPGGVSECYPDVHMAIDAIKRHFRRQEIDRRAAEPAREDAA